MPNSKNHHWWPKGVSSFWKDADGCVARISPNGELLRQPPKNFGVIGHGHSIKLGRKPGDSTAFDYNFESEFQHADDNFPSTIRWLEGLERESRPNESILTNRFLTQDDPEEKLSLLVEGLISLAIRGPMYRSAAVRLAEHFRGPLPTRERNALVGLNMHGHQRTFVTAIGTRGKFAVIYSPERELIFGDGFFHNITSPAGAPYSPKILVPLTPNISVLFARPSIYTTKPRLSTLVITPDEAERLNQTVQIYAKEMLFYRSEKPTIIDEFRQNQHLQYGEPNPIDVLIHSIPGVPPRDGSLDFLLAPNGLN